MENIQKLIKELKSAKRSQLRFANKEKDEIMQSMFRGQVLALNFTLKKLKLLLNDESNESNDSQNKQVEAFCSHPYKYIHISWDCQEVSCNCCGKELD